MPKNGRDNGSQAQQEKPQERPSIETVIKHSADGERIVFPEKRPNEHWDSSEKEEMLKALL